MAGWGCTPSRPDPEHTEAMAILMTPNHRVAADRLTKELEQAEAYTHWLQPLTPGAWPVVMALRLTVRAATAMARHLDQQPPRW